MAKRRWVVITLMAAVAAVMIIAISAAIGVVASDDEPARVSTTPDCSLPGTPVTMTTVAPTVAPTTTSSTTTTVPPEPVLRAGSSGPAVAELERRLTELRYWVGTLDDAYDDDTAHAVTAFQKVAGLQRDGAAGPQVFAALPDAAPPANRSSEGSLIEIDLARQVLLLVRDGRTATVFDVSTGKPSTPTATGRFEIEREIDGYHRSKLGVLYRPEYFHGGQAMHGFPNVPPYPASHGCVRLTNHAIDWLWEDDRAPIGTDVWVYR
jgi:peptidoglycan hydrolase-like protein with peptidoglycan-binding domain